MDKDIVVEQVISEIASYVRQMHATGKPPLFSDLPLVLAHLKSQPSADADVKCEDDGSIADQLREALKPFAEIANRKAMLYLRPDDPIVSRAKEIVERTTSPLIVTKNGIPFEDQAEGIRQFKEACLVPSTDASSYAEFQQRRGRLPDLIESTISIYNDFMRDDDYDQQGCLDRIVAKLKSARDFYDRQSSTDATVDNVEGFLEDALCASSWAKCLASVHDAKAALQSHSSRADAVEARVRQQEQERDEAREYRGWSIHQGRWPEPAWMATGPNYDASYEGPEDGWVASGESAFAATRAELIEEIDIWIEEHGDAQ